MNTKPKVIRIEVSDTIELREMVSGKHKKLGFKRPISEFKSGHDFHRDTKTWRLLERIIDRGKNWYKEIISDLKGNIIHSKEGPLDKHIGHGCDKKITNS